MIPQNMEELQKIPAWINYIRIWNPTKGGRGGYDKPPINPFTLRDGKTNDTKAWTTYDRAAANIGKTATHADTKHRDAQGNAPIIKAQIEGVGLVLAGGYCGIDLDNVIDSNGSLLQWAREIVERLDTYTEISPSGRGLHLIMYCKTLLDYATEREISAYKERAAAGMNKLEAVEKAKNVWKIGRQYPTTRTGEVTSDDRKDCELEIYFYKWGGRYLTVTGNVYLDRPINHANDAEYKAIVREYDEKSKAYKAEQAKRRAADFKPLPVDSLTTAQASGDDNKRMVYSALSAIPPDDLDFGQWFCIVGAIKYSEFLTYADFEKWTAGDLCGTSNPRNIPGNNAGIWNRAKLQDTSNTERLIIKAAQRYGWKASEAFTDDERKKYAYSLHNEADRQKWARNKYSEEERREYGRQLHARDWTDEDAAALDEWRRNH